MGFPGGFGVGLGIPEVSMGAPGGVQGEAAAKRPPSSRLPQGRGGSLGILGILGAIEKPDFWSKTQNSIFLSLQL